jgi:hypothetical protein
MTVGTALRRWAVVCAPAACGAMIAALAVAPVGASASTTFDIRGKWQVVAQGGAPQSNTYDTIDLSTGRFTGHGANDPPLQSVTWSISGTVTGNRITQRIAYTSGGYTATATGTIASDGNHMAGTFSDSAGHNGFTWSATRVTGPPSAKPVLGRAVSVGPAGGHVLVKRPGQGFVPLSGAQQIPVGSLLDTSGGTVRLTSAANTRGAVQTGDFSGGVFQVGQSRTGGGLTDLKLSGGSFRDCIAMVGSRAAAATLSSRVVRRLRGKARGRFRTRGRYSAATVRGTNWTVEDRCDGTLTRVKTGVVVVNDFHKRRSITIRAGKSYLARAG